MAKKPEITFVTLRKPDKSRRVKLFKMSASCGEMINPDEVAEIVDVNDLIETKNGEKLAIANGTSMIGVGIYPGDYLVLDYNRSAKNGDIVVASYEGDSTVKLFHHDKKKNVVTLYAANPDCEKKVYSGEDLENFEVFAVVVKVLRNMKNGITLLNKLRNEDKQKNIRERIDRVFHLIKNKRHWFAVCKGMMQLKMVGNNDFGGAMNMISELMDIQFTNDDIDSVAKMNVQSMCKSIDKWDETDAPVTGARFFQYKKIAEEFIE